MVLTTYLWNILLHSGLSFSFNSFMIIFISCKLCPTVHRGQRTTHKSQVFPSTMLVLRLVLHFTGQMPLPWSWRPWTFTLSTMSIAWWQFPLCLWETNQGIGNLPRQGWRLGLCSLASLSHLPVCIYVWNMMCLTMDEWRES